MNLRELENSLPNGLHDAEVKRIEIDYEKGVAVFDMRLWTGDMSSDDPAVRERYQEAKLRLNGLIYCVIEPPAYSWIKKAEPFCIDAGSASEKKIITKVDLPDNLPEGSFAYWFFVNEWNSFIHIAAMDAVVEMKND